MPFQFAAGTKYKVLALKGVPRDRYLMATKCGRYDDAVFDFSAERVTRSVDESLQRLGLDTIDIFQVHDIEFGSPPHGVCFRNGPGCTSTPCIDSTFAFTGPSSTSRSSMKQAPPSTATCSSAAVSTSPPPPTVRPNKVVSEERS